MPSAPLRRAAIVLIAAAGLVALSGCAVTSPAIITRPYVAADGTDAQLDLPDGTTLSMRNFVIVLDEDGGTGQVIGAVAYSATGTIPFSLEARNSAQVGTVEPNEEEAAASGSTAPVQPSVIFEVTGGQLNQVGPTGTPFVLPVVDVDPGQYIDLTASSPVTGSVTWQVPVVAAVSYYAGLAASPTGTASPSPTDGGSTPTETTPAETTPGETTPAEGATTSP